MHVWLPRLGWSAKHPSQPGPSTTRQFNVEHAGGGRCRRRRAERWRLWRFSGFSTIPPDRPTTKLPRQNNAETSEEMQRHARTAKRPKKINASKTTKAVNTSQDCHSYKHCEDHKHFTDWEEDEGHRDCEDCGDHKDTVDDDSLYGGLCWLSRRRRQRQRTNYGSNATRHATSPTQPRNPRNQQPTTNKQQTTTTTTGDE